MHRHDPDNNVVPRVAVIREKDSVQIGTMPAQVGMMLTISHRVLCVNKRSITVQHPEQHAYRLGSGACVHEREARRFGFKLPDEKKRPRLKPLGVFPTTIYLHMHECAECGPFTVHGNQPTHDNINMHSVCGSHVHYLRSAEYCAVETPGDET